MLRLLVVYCVGVYCYDWVLCCARICDSLCAVCCCCCVLHDVCCGVMLCWCGVVVVCVLCGVLLLS